MKLRFAKIVLATTFLYGFAGVNASEWSDYEWYPEIGKQLAKYIGDNADQAGAYHDGQHYYYKDDATGNFYYQDEYGQTHWAPVVQKDTVQNPTGDNDRDGINNATENQLTKMQEEIDALQGKVEKIEARVGLDSPSPQSVSSFGSAPNHSGYGAGVSASPYSAPRGGGMSGPRPGDKDGDGIPDAVDPDDNNDGIPDVMAQRASAQRGMQNCVCNNNSGQPAMQRGMPARSAMGQRYNPSSAGSNSYGQSSRGAAYGARSQSSRMSSARGAANAFRRR